MKGKRALVSIVTSLALVGVAAPAHADAASGNVIGTGATVMGIACNVLNNILGLGLCGQ